jgi:hypothetical protein
MPSFCNDDVSEDHASQNSSSISEFKASPRLDVPQDSIVGLPLFAVKNTFIHVDRPFDEDCDFGTPPRSVSVPNMFIASSSPETSPANAHSDSLASEASSEAGENSGLSPGSVDEFAFGEYAGLSNVDGSEPATRAMPSAGASLHGSGKCKPCAWFWKPLSCKWGAACGHCHMCPEGELRIRKKQRVAGLKAERARLAAATSS